MTSAAHRLDIRFGDLRVFFIHRFGSSGRRRDRETTSLVLSGSEVYLGPGDRRAQTVIDEDGLLISRERKG